MFLTRVIPALLVRGNSGLFKGIGFKDHKYVGDPMNAIRIFNNKQVDELVLLDISATAENRCIPVELVSRVASECFMPLSVGGGISTLDAAGRLLRAGTEKVIINSAAFNSEVVSQIAGTFGSQAVVVSIDYKKGWFGKKEVFTHAGTRGTGLRPLEAALKAQEMGAGEILLTSIDHEGAMAGFDLETIREIASSVRIPIIAQGGASDTRCLARPVNDAAAHAVAAGSIFVFHGPRRAVLISFPSEDQLVEAFE